MPAKILLVGHCGPDSTYLRMAVKSAAGGDVTILSADDDKELESAIQSGVDLVLFNRELAWGFDPNTGVEMIRALRKSHPDLRMMLVSNLPDAQAEAVAAGALPGFGKRQIGSTQAKELLRGALSPAAAKPTTTPNP
jgi:DNA-binding NarL/FixJ family response regulator